MAIETTPTPKTFRYTLGCILLPLIVVIVGLMGWMVAYNYAGIFHVAEVQQAVDAQCGTDRVMVDWHDIGTDPIVGWSDGTYTCVDTLEGMVCSCGEGASE